VNMTDLARRRGIHLQPEALAEALGCEAVLVSARTGEGLSELAAALTRARIPLTPPGDEPGLSAWAERAFVAAASAPTGTGDGADTFTDRLDRAFTHPVLGTLVFVAVMTGLFWTLYTLARFPMDWIELIFTALTGLVTDVVPAGAVRDLLANGVVAGVGATVIFLPQVCLLFFLISLLEDTGYLARAAFVMDRVLRPFGLPGHSFVPLLSSHACALPGIMACRSIPDRRQRLATILVAPFMTCSARLPVYVLLIGILLGERPALAAIAFVGCYALGIAAGVGSAMIARRTILRGAARPMALELPTYKRPSFRTALLTTLDRARMFLRKAGTAILAICIVLWWLSAYPRVAPPAEAVRLREEAVRAEATWPADLSTGTPARAGEEGDRPGRAPLPPDEARALADELEARHAQRHSFAGRLGRAVQPVFEPLGYDWQLTIGLLTSLAAREVFVSTMSVVLAGTDDAEDQTIKQRIVTARRDDGVTPVFTPAASWSLLVYYVLAMQCLPTLAVTAREAGGVRWALLQLAWMTGLAYLAALVTFQVLA
ncbi:MAG TPA: ferrous iron transporter B, partial [Phycisphaerales bacterium]|nr:ferrous iron transporter B [Phycisphaerales bacterium]